ncbi:MAG: signaling protein [Luteolibacter sp.]
MTKILLSITAIALSSSLLQAADIYVSTTGKDSNPGTGDSPLASLSAARDAAREFAGKEAVTVHVGDGVYYLPETLVFSPEDSGTEAVPVVYQAVNDGAAILSGGSLLSLQWEDYKDGIAMAKTPEGLVIDQLFIDGKNQRMARYPNYDAAKKAEPYQGFSADAFSKERAARWADPEDGYIHAMHRSSWGGYHYRITGKDDKGEVTYEGGWQNNRQMGMHKDFRMVENIFEELDAPGEWFHNAKTNTLYYMPVDAAGLAKAKVEVVRLRHLVEFQGTEQSPVKHITLKGFVVRHAARTFMDTKEPMVRSDWAIYRGGSVFLTGTENVSILDSEFDQVGGNAIFVNNYNRNTLVKGCHIHDAGASGVCFVGDPDALRDPLFEYGEKNDLDKIDRTPGPKTNNYPSLGTVEDCLIHGIGRVERQPAGVQIEMAMKITARDLSIYDCARSGINIGDGAFGGHLIERCDVFDTVLETHDHGSFNSWGRDRYWRSDQPVSQAAVDKDPKLPFLDAIHTTVIRDSRWRCDHGWDIDLDDGSTNYDIYNNLMLNTGLKLREGFRRHAWNNVAPFGKLHPHVWYHGSKDQVYSNIFKSGHAPARMAEPYTDGTMVDKNLFIDANAKKVSEKLGWDSNSITGDPMFVDPASGDFRVKDGSPALEIGFKNFPMDQFGVKKPSLKAIARTPEIPAYGDAQKGVNVKGKGKAFEMPKFEYFWAGAALAELVGEEFSAFGVSQEDGGVVLSGLGAESIATLSGLLDGDVIQKVNGQKTGNLAEFMAALVKAGDSPLSLEVIRNQAPVTVAMKAVPFVVYETGKSAADFSKIALKKSDGSFTTNPATSDAPLETLTDGALGKSYGSVFPNGVSDGTYKLDLGASKSVTAINSWTFKMGPRLTQKITIYGSNMEIDPGWNVSDSAKFTPISSIDTSALPSDQFAAASLRSPEGSALGQYRWIVWKVWPISKSGENSAIQELSVETSD